MVIFSMHDAALFRTERTGGTVYARALLPSERESIP